MLQVKNLIYEVVQDGQTKRILDNISFVVDDEQLLVITGPNGSGKSTLAKILMGILPPTSGQIVYNGQDITKLDISSRAKLGFGYAFQQPTTFKGLTVKDLIDIASGAKNSASSACEYLSRVGLCAREYIDREVDNKLSGGELKRIELAVLLAKNSKINICDEPEAGIDLWSFDALVKLFENEKKTFLVISHQRRLIEIADKIVLLKKGKIECEGTFEKMKHLLENQTCGRLNEVQNG
jgi:Fe-S cluster assembly ATP-binding protein